MLGSTKMLIVSPYSFCLSLKDSMYFTLLLQTVLLTASKLWTISNIHSVSWLVDITAGGNFLGLCDQKSSYKHVSDFGRLRSYGHFLIPVHALVWTAPYGTSWRVMYSTWWLIVCRSCKEQLTQFTTEWQPVLWPAVAFSITSFNHRSFKLKVISWS